MFKRRRWIILLTLAVGPFLGVVVGGWIAYTSPKLYESGALVQPLPIGQTRGLAVEALSSEAGSRFIASELEIVRCQKVLDIVIDMKELDKKWGADRELVRTRLDRAIFTSNIEGTDLIEICVRTPSPKESREIADALVQAYTARRRGLASLRLDRQLIALRDSVLFQEDVVEEKRKVVLLMIKKGSSSVAAWDAEATSEDGAAAIARHLREDAEAELHAARSLHENLRLKLVDQEINVRSSVDSVIVHSDPVEAMSPAYPQVKRLLWWGMIAGAMLAVLLAVFEVIFFCSQRHRTS